MMMILKQIEEQLKSNSFKSINSFGDDQPVCCITLCQLTHFQNAKKINP